MVHSSKKGITDISLSSLKNKSKDEVIRLFLSQNEVKIPVNVFSKKLSPLTALVKYLHYDKEMPIKEIAARLNRHEQTIYTIIHLTKKSRLNIKSGAQTVPLSIFAKEKFSILETLTNHLITEYKMSITEISVLLNKSVKTIWTCNSRYRIKGEKK